MASSHCDQARIACQREGKSEGKTFRKRAPQLLSGQLIFVEEKKLPEQGSGLRKVLDMF